MSPLQTMTRRDWMGAAGAAAGLGAMASSTPLICTGKQVEQGSPLLDQFDASSPANQLALIRQFLRDQPLEFFRELRKHRPVLESIDATLLARHADVVDVLSHPTVFMVGLYAPKMGDFMLAVDETPINWRDKGAMQAMLSRDDSTRIREIVAATCAEALAASGGRIEIVGSLSRLAPVRLVGEHFGFPGPDTPTMMRWSYLAQLDNFHNQPFQALPDSAAVHQKAIAAKLEMRDYAVKLIQERSAELAANPSRDDVLSRLLKTRFPPSIGFGPERLVINVIGLLVGAVETTSQAIVHVLDGLLQRPDRLAQARASAEAKRTAELAGIVWETLRFNPIAPYLFRRAEQDYTVGAGTDHAHTIRAGTTVLALTLSAMFDESAVEAPEDFRADRPAYAYFHFGYGHHRCLGEHIGGDMIVEVVRHVVLCKNLRRAPGEEGRIDYRGGPFPESFVLEFDV
jgi:cytochrome P450